MKYRVCLPPILLGTATSPNLSPSPQKFLYTSGISAYCQTLLPYLCLSKYKRYMQLLEKRGGKKTWKGQMNTLFFFFFFSFPCVLLNSSFGRTVLVHTCNCLMQSSVECLSGPDYPDGTMSIQRSEKIQLWLHFAVTPLFIMHIYVTLLLSLWQNGIRPK